MWCGPVGAIALEVLEDSLNTAFVADVVTVLSDRPVPRDRAVTVETIEVHQLLSEGDVIAVCERTFSRRAP